jgi:hypothetical protein
MLRHIGYEREVVRQRLRPTPFGKGHRTLAYSMPDSNFWNGLLSPFRKDTQAPNYWTLRLRGCALRI